MTQDYRRFLRPEELSRISRLEIRARHIVEGFLSGLHRSPYFGQSVEFVQHREYAQGDDIRRIDWKVWSKTDKYYIKQYEEDTNLRTTLVVELPLDRGALQEAAAGAGGDVEVLLYTPRGFPVAATLDTVGEDTGPEMQHKQAIIERILSGPE